MERLTYGENRYEVKGAGNRECRDVCNEIDEKSGCTGCPIANVFDRLGQIEDILGDTYDLDRLRELVEADKDGRCFVRPDFVFRIGETRGIIKVPYKPWMDRFMGTKFYKSEKEAAEAALAKEAK